MRFTGGFKNPKIDAVVQRGVRTCLEHLNPGAWVASSIKLGLVRDVPASLSEQVGSGQVGHASGMSYPQPALGGSSDSRLTCDYGILLGNIPPRDIPLAIAHECVHLDQMRRGELVLDRGRDGKLIAFWMGEEVDPSSAYRDLPWERDALKRQSGVESVLQADQVFQDLMVSAFRRR